MVPNEPCYDVAHLGHIELLTNKPEESLNFFVNVYGLTETGREGESVYLRGFDDYEFHTLKLTASDTIGAGHIAYRCSSPQALERRVAAIEKLGGAIGWTDGDLGHGRSFRFHDPAGHVFEIYYDTQKYEAPEEEKPALKNTAQRYHGRGACVRRLDHLNLCAADVAAIREWMPKALGSRLTEQIVFDSGLVTGCWFSVNNKGYDIAYALDPSKPNGGLNHITYAADQREDILRAADIYIENDVYIVSGPHKHAVQGTFFLYALEPAGNIVEIANSGARLILQPDWETVTWTEAERKKGQAWGLYRSN